MIANDQRVCQAKSKKTVGLKSNEKKINSIQMLLNSLLESPTKSKRNDISLNFNLF